MKTRSIPITRRFAVFCLLGLTTAAFGEPLVSATSGQLLIECISVPLPEAHKLCLAAHSDAELYAGLQTAVTAGSAEVADFITLPLKSGHRTSGVAATEEPFPTDFDPPQLPQIFEGDTPPDRKDFSHTDICPTSFEIKNTGLAVEAEVSVSEAGLQLTTSLERITYRGEQVWPAPKTPSLAAPEYHQPLFEHQTINTVMSNSWHRPTFLGTMNPAPADVLGGVVADPTKARVWFAFGTPKPN
jgi:hypothetical protein